MVSLTVVTVFLSTRQSIIPYKGKYYIDKQLVCLQRGDRGVGYKTQHTFVQDISERKY